MTVETDPKNLNQLIKSLALGQGFCACGVTRADFLEEDAQVLEKWVAEGRHGQMSYMARNREKRANVRLLVEGAKSIVCLAHSYYTRESEEVSKRTGVAKYAVGEDYHTVLKNKMHALCAALKEKTGDFSYRAFTDSAPVPERRLAQRAGLGWIGKSSMFISPDAGSYLFLSEIVTDLDIAPDTPFEQNKCGSCRRCRMACPTGAIDGSGTIDARKCLSYVTIELKENIPEKLACKLGGRIYGCDTCMDVCPWNKYAALTEEPCFLPSEYLSRMDREDWAKMDPETFEREFTRSPMQRAGLDKIKSNVAAGKKYLAGDGF